MSDQTNDSTIFENKETQKEETTQQSTEANVAGEGKESTEQSTSNPLADLLKSIQAPDGRQKYDSVEDALKAMPHAQTHIQTLEEENTSLKEQQEALAAQLEKVNQLEETLKTMAQNSSTSEQPSGELDEQKLAQIVETLLTKKETESKMKVNQEAVATTLVNKFGDKAEQMYNQKAQELGIPVSELNRLAGTSKAAVLAWFGEAPASNISPSTGSINTEGFRETKPREKGPNPLLMGSNNLMEAWERAGTK